MEKPVLDLFIAVNADNYYVTSIRNTVLTYICTSFANAGTAVIYLTE
ncbi:hypothetical protein [Ructibacterium gallinarum]|nr:hypothetical protein [Ructibacterium gallinarum]